MVDDPSVTAESYGDEPVGYPPLRVIDLVVESTEAADGYSNIVVNRVNQHCLRLVVFDGDYPWHHHPTSDELFLVVGGCLLVDLADGRTLRLEPWQAVTVRQARFTGPVPKGARSTCASRS